MADNVAITAGAGTTIGADEVVDGTLGTVKVQYVKLMDGTLDGTAKALVGANGLAVDVKAAVAIAAGSAVIGHVIADTGSTTAVTGNVTVVQGTGTNLHAVLDANSGVDIGKLTANQSVNVAQLAGTTTDTNSGNKSAGTLRIVLATDQPALTNKLLVTPDSVALPANQSVNVAQINGVTTTMGNGVSGTGVQRVTIASDSTGTVAVTESGTWTVQPGNTANTTPWLMGHGKSRKVKTGAASATFTIIAAVSTKILKVYSLSLMTASATAVTVTFKDGAGGTVIGTYILQAISGTNFGIAEGVPIPSSLFETTAGNLLEMAFSAAVSVTYNVRYWDDDTT